MGKTEIKINKPVYLGQAILDLSKTLMYEFHHDYMRPKYGGKIKLCYMDTNSFVYEIDTEDFYRDIAKGVEKSFDTGGYSKDGNRPLPIEKNKRVIGLMKDEVGGKIMAKFVALRAKMYAYRKIDKKKWRRGTAKVQKNVWLLKALRLMIISRAFLMVKQYTGSKFCLRIRSARCTRSISIETRRCPEQRR